MTAPQEIQDELKTTVKKYGDLPLSVTEQDNYWVVKTVPAELDINIIKYRFFRKEDMTENTIKSYYTVTITRTNSRHEAKFHYISDVVKFITKILQVCGE